MQPKSEIRKKSIYSLTCPITNNVRYIGSSYDLKNRLTVHLKGKQKSTNKWFAELNEKGLMPIMRELERVFVDLVGVREKFWINFYDEKYPEGILNISNNNRYAVDKFKIIYLDENN